MTESASPTLASTLEQSGRGQRTDDGLYEIEIDVEMLIADLALGAVPGITRNEKPPLSAALDAVFRSGGKQDLVYLELNYAESESAEVMFAAAYNAAGAVTERKQAAAKAKEAQR